MKIQKLEKQLKQNNKLLHQLEEEKTLSLNNSSTNNQKLNKSNRNRQTHTQTNLKSNKNYNQNNNSSYQNKNYNQNRRDNEKIERIELIETVLDNGNINDILQLLETVDPSFILVIYYLFFISIISNFYYLYN